jgi:hypothetical protein
LRPVWALVEVRGVALVEVLVVAAAVALVEAAVALVEVAVALVEAAVAPVEEVLLAALLGMPFHIRSGGSIHLAWINFTATSLFRFCALGEIDGTILQS